MVHNAFEDSRGFAADPRLCNYHRVGAVVSTDGGNPFELEDRTSGAGQETVGHSSTRELAGLF